MKTHLENICTLFSDMKCNVNKNNYLLQILVNVTGLHQIFSCIVLVRNVWRFSGFFLTILIFTCQDFGLDIQLIITDPETCYYTSCTVRFGTLFVQRGSMHHTCTLFKRNLDTICFEFSHPTDLQWNLHSNIVENVSVWITCCLLCLIQPIK